MQRRSNRYAEPDRPELRTVEIIERGHPLRTIPRLLDLTRCEQLKCANQGLGLTGIAQEGSQIIGFTLQNFGDRPFLIDVVREGDSVAMRNVSDNIFGSKFRKCVSIY